MADVALRAQGIHAGYGGDDILSGVSIEVRRGSIVAIIGPNGSGKSTLLKAIYGLVPPRLGQVELRGRDGTLRPITGLPPHRVTALGANMVPQLANVFPEMSVRENLEIGSLQSRNTFSTRLDRVLAMLPMLGGMLGKRAATLSGGQRQMLAIGRALMSEPSVLILDEPSAGLSPLIQGEVFAKLKEINNQGVSMLMVEQRARQCLAIADYAYVLEQGRNRLEGRGSDLLVDPEVVRLYLGAVLATRRATPEAAP